MNELPDLFDFHFGDDELSNLLRAVPAVPAPADAPAAAAPAPPRVEVHASPELRAVSDRICLQFVDVLANTASHLLARSTGGGALDQLDAALGNLARLLGATEDDTKGALVAELQDQVAVWRGRGAGQRGRRRFLDHLRSWLPRMGAAMGGAAEERLRGVVELQGEPAPLLEELARIHGIGERRIARLYAAGLYTVDELAHADPEEVAQVTGVPRKLAEEAVARTRAFAAERRRTVVTHLRQRLHDFEALLSRLDPDADPELARAAADALGDLQRMVSAYSLPTPVPGDSP